MPEEGVGAVLIALQIPMYLPIDFSLYFAIIYTEKVTEEAIMLTKEYKEMSRLVVYQIYPRSFMDSNGDGIGDLKGVESKLDHLRELGVNAIWLCPCYKSPNVDNGYDVADYRDIMDEFGTMEDMKSLIAAAHEKGIKIIMDLVPNHTSDQHKWFLESKKGKDNPYSDFYYWFDQPQNDWQACFGGSAWEYCEERGQYYLHSYAVEQPDLNWDNPRVRQEMCDVIDFWVQLGVDGFRIDVIDQISKNMDGYNCFGPHLHEYIRQMFGREEVRHLFTVGECWASTLEEVRNHCAAERRELTTLFQFEHLEAGRDTKYIRKPQSLSVVRDILVKWQRIADDNDLLYSLFTDNHDSSQFLSRMGNDRELRYESATCIAAMFYTLRGIPFIYMGQEFGTPLPHYDSMEHFNDIECVNKYHEEAPLIGHEQALERCNFGSRDGTRRPMSWNGGKYAGFSTTKPWLTPNSRYKEVNLEADKSGCKSVFRFYRDLLKLRRESDAILYGSLEVLSKEEDPYFLFEREYQGEKLTVAINFERESSIPLPEDAQVVLRNYSDTAKKFRPYEVIILKHR